MRALMSDRERLQRMLDVEAKDSNQ